MSICHVGRRDTIGMNIVREQEYSLAVVLMSRVHDGFLDKWLWNIEAGGRNSSKDTVPAVIAVDIVYVPGINCFTLLNLIFIRGLDGVRGHSLIK